jgi:hypothetical protein
VRTITIKLIEKKTGARSNTLRLCFDYFFFGSDFAS